MLVIFIASAIDRGTRFTTNSRVAKMLAAVSLSRRSGDPVIKTKHLDPG